MKYLEMILNERINELIAKQNQIIENLRAIIMSDEFDLENDWICDKKIDYDEIWYRLNEIKKLKKDLGLEPIEDLQVSNVEKSCEE